MRLFLKEKKKAITLFTLIFFHLLLISFQVPLGDKENYFEKTIFSIFSPAQHGMIYFFKKVSDIWNGYFHLWEVEKMNKELKEEIFLLRQENSQLRRALQRLKAERNVQDFIANLHDSFFITRVIGIDARNIYKSIIIAKGSLHGLKKNMVVLDKQGHLVGRIIDPISLKEAKVQLITDIESGVSVVSQESRAGGVLTGDGKGNCHLKYIYPTQKVSKGEELVTSGLDHIYPPGIKVGKIVLIKTEASLFKMIKVKTSFEFSDLNMVVVIPRDSGEILLEDE
jgi:rod shape-determining protein MreC